MNNNQTNKTELYICMAKSCRENFSEDIFKHALQLKNKQLIANVHPQTCLGRCSNGPCAIIKRENQNLIITENLTKANIDKIASNK